MALKLSTYFNSLNIVDNNIYLHPNDNKFDALINKNNLPIKQKDILILIDCSVSKKIDSWIIITEEKLFSKQPNHHLFTVENKQINNCKVIHQVNVLIKINNIIINKFLGPRSASIIHQPKFKNVQSIFDKFQTFLDKYQENIRQENQQQIAQQNLEEEKKNIELAKQLLTPHIAVVATMSAGKSTLINALIGDEYLHSANQATTAKITIIKHPAKKWGVLSYLTECLCTFKPKLMASALFFDNTLVKNSQPNNKLLADWNKNADIQNINLEGRICSAPKHSIGLTLIDTPGPNNSSEESHRLVLVDFINKPYLYTHIFYILNATQFAIKDDKKLLTQLATRITQNPKRKVIFILNKVDQLDVEKNESVAYLIKKVDSYLIKNGFDKPIIIPFSSNIALASRKLLAGQSLSRAEKNLLLNELENPPLEDWLMLSSVPENVLNKAKSMRNKASGRKKITLGQNQYSTKQIKKLALSSGLAIVEQLIKNELKQFKIDLKQRNKTK